VFEFDLARERRGSGHWWFQILRFIMLHNPNSRQGQHDRRTISNIAAS
jgi:hypothetical protein